MTKQKLFKHVLPIILSAMLLFSVLPVSASANDESTDEAASKIVREVVELREESVKHFLCEDGSYIAVSYAEPVHYEKNGEWLEIDNTLVLSSENTYVPKANNLAVSIPQSFSGGEQITATNDGHTISFGVASGNENVALSKTAAVKSVEALPSSIAADVSVETLTNAELSATATVGKVDTAAQIEAYNSEKTTVDNQAGALVYDKIFLNADLEYIVTGNSIKENIVVYQPQTEYVYTFDMDFGGLTPIAEDDGSYRLIDSAKPEETVFVLAAPYMYDANGVESYEVEMLLTENGGNYLLTLTADEEWINSSEREFPVVIDPTVCYDFDDVFVMDGLLNQNTTKIKNELRVGRNLTNLTRTYIKISESHNIPYGSVIKEAKLILTNKNYYQAPLQDNINIKLYDCSNVAAWSATSVTWNNQPFGNTEGSYSSYGATLLSSIPATNNEGSNYEFDIKPAVENWLETGINKGFMLASSDESSKTQIDFYSSRADESNPIIEISYTVPSLGISEWNLTVPDAATSSEITITTTKDWTITVDQPWISVSKTSGTGNSTFTISVTENTSVSQRTGYVTVWMGSVKIGEIKVEQSGSGAYLLLDETPIFIDYKTCSKTVAVDTNDSSWEIALELWNNTNNIFESVIIDDNNNSAVAWLEVNKNDGGIDLIVRSENTEAFARKARITVTAQSDTNTVTKTIHITQYDKVTCLFNTINDDGTLSAISSTEYNHALATWAMELSYAAYNPVEYEAIPGIPSSFMHAPFNNAENTAKADLLSKGFLATEYNYEEGADIYAAHTIGYRNIDVNTTQESGGANNDNSTYINDVVGNIGDNSANFSTVEAYSIVDSFQIGGNSGENDLTSTDNIGTRPLVVVAIRGSVTFADWVIDLGTQFNDEHHNFQTGMKEVIKSLYGCTELCDECNGTGCENASAGYLDGINNPVILITGHSLGAAIANLTANYLTEKLGEDSVYAYTFATPYTVNEAKGEVPVEHDNIFNILNNNDAVPHYPMNLVVNEWARHGRDFHFTMPLVTQGIELFDIDLLGAFGHGMPNYYSWLNNLPGTLGKPAEDITVSDLEERSVDFAVGLGALLFKILCPVSVTLYDTDGNIVAFESQQEGAVYPEITDTGIVSWIAEDGGKMFLIPYGTEDIEARIEAYDYGTMTLTVEQPEIGEPLDSKTYNNVNLFPGRTFEVVIPEDTEEVSIGNVSLVEVDENGDTIGEITELDSYLKSVTVDDPEVTYGTTSTFTVITDKDAVKIQFIYHDSGSTMTLTRDHSLVTSLVEDGDNLIWTVQKVFTRGNHIFDFGVKMGSTWYITEQVIALTVN